MKSARCFRTIKSRTMFFALLAGVLIFSVVVIDLQGHYSLPVRKFLTRFHFEQKNLWSQSGWVEKALSRYGNLTYLPGYEDLSFAETALIRFNKTMDTVKDEEAEHIYYDFISRIHINCVAKQRVGNAGDGGWDLCMAAPYRPTHSNCLVYSFGINNDFSFDDHISRLYNCSVRSFDPSMTKNDHFRSANVHFKKLGLGSEYGVTEQNWTVNSLDGIRHTLGHDKGRMDVLKIDIEKNEWPCLRQMLVNGSLADVSQLVFEIHTHEMDRRASTARDFAWMHDLLLDIERAGFRRFHYHENPFGKYVSVRTGMQRSCCHELGYINLRLLAE